LNATIPSDRVLWSVIDAPAGGVRGGRIPTGLWPLIEDDLPIDPAEVWAVGVPIDADRIAVCAVRRADLEAIDPVALSLSPDAAPDFVAVPAGRFNFLIGEYEPRTIRSTRFRRHVVAAACALLAACLVGVGLTRRASAWKAQAAAATAASEGVLASIAPKRGWTRDDLELELLERSVPGAPEHANPSDAAVALAGIIGRWPTQVPCKPQSITATGSAASISVTIPGDAQAFLARLKAPEGWTIDEPRLAAIDKVTRLNLELRRTEGGAP
jgi:hypothetical protein